MDLQKHLDEIGYTEDLERLQAARDLHKLLTETPLGNKRPDLLPQLYADIDAMAVEIEKIERSMTERYQAAVKYVDAMNIVEIVFDHSDQESLCLKALEGTMASLVLS